MSAASRWPTACMRAAAPGGTRQRLALLPVLSGRAGIPDDRAGRFRVLEDRLNGNPARSLQSQPDRLGLPARRTEPVLPTRILEMQEHLHRRILPDQPAGLDQDPIAWPQIAHE